MAAMDPTYMPDPAIHTAMQITANLRTVRANFICILTSKVTAPQDAHRRLVLQVFLGSNTF